MTQYILKSALAAEIQKLQKHYREIKIRSYYEDGLKVGRLIGYKDVLDKLDTFEVKEVDLEKELIGFQNRYAYENSGELPSAIEIAKHFFELGLKAHKKE